MPMPRLGHEPGPGPLSVPHHWFMNIPGVRGQSPRRFPPAASFPRDFPAGSLPPVSALPPEPDQQIPTCPPACTCTAFTAPAPGRRGSARPGEGGGHEQDMNRTWGQAVAHRLRWCVPGFSPWDPDPSVAGPSRPAAGLPAPAPRAGLMPAAPLPKACPARAGLPRPCRKGRARGGASAAVVRLRRLLPAPADFAPAGLVPGGARRFCSASGGRRTDRARG